MTDNTRAPNINMTTQYEDQSDLSLDHYSNDTDKLECVLDYAAAMINFYNQNDDEYCECDRVILEFSRRFNQYQNWKSFARYVGIDFFVLSIQMLSDGMLDDDESEYQIFLDYITAIIANERRLDFDGIDFGARSLSGHRALIESLSRPS